MVDRLHGTSVHQLADVYMTVTGTDQYLIVMMQKEGTVSLITETRQKMSMVMATMIIVAQEHGLIVRQTHSVELGNIVAQETV